MSKKLQNHQKYQNIAGILLVGGYSSRMKTLKALLPFNTKESLLTHSLSLLQEAGVQHIYVVLGYECERIEKHIKDWEKEENSHFKACKIIYNPRFDEGMYTSVCAGFSAILQDNEVKGHAIEASFLLPVDAALLQAKTLTALLNHHDCTFNNQAANAIRPNSIIIPTFLDKCGHPPLITQEHFEPILRYEQECKENPHKEKFRGLQGYFNQFLSSDMQKIFLQGFAPQPSAYIQHDAEKNSIHFLPLADEGVLCDLDTPQEYEKAMYFLKLTENRKNLSLLESWHILTHNNLTDRIMRHSYKVGRGAFRLYTRLQEKYAMSEQDLMTCFCGGLLHDICRLQKHHAEAGGDFIENIGYKKIASIIKAHTNLPLKIVQELDDCIEYFSAKHIQNSSQKREYDIKRDSILNREQETQKEGFKMHKSSLPILCVHLADKFYAGENFISMQKRFEYIRERFADDEKALKAIEKREEIAKKTAYWFFCETNSIAEECVEIPSQHDFERIIQEHYDMLI